MYNQPTETIIRYLTREGRNRYNVVDEDPDPFLLKEIKSDSVLPQYEVDGLPLPRGIRPDQLRYKFTADVTKHVLFFLFFQNMTNRKVFFLEGLCQEISYDHPCVEFYRNNLFA